MKARLSKEARKLMENIESASEFVKAAQKAKKADNLKPSIYKNYIIRKVSGYDPNKASKYDPKKVPGYKPNKVPA